MSKIHAGFEVVSGGTLTACGRIVRPLDAPLSLSTTAITCRQCRRKSNEAIEATKRDILQQLIQGKDPFTWDVP